jgi:hypothetical protein
VISDNYIDGQLEPFGISLALAGNTKGENFMNSRSLYPNPIPTLVHLAKHAVRKLWFLCLLSVGLTLASVAFAEEPLEIEKITCEGNKKSTCAFIQGQISLREGEQVDDEKIKESKLRLQLVGYFQDVDIRLSKGSQPGKAIVTVSVVERSSYSYSISAGVAQPQKPFNGSVDIIGADRNFTGNGDTLSLRVRSETKKPWGSSSSLFSNTLRLEYLRPNFLFPRMYAVTGLGGELTSVNGSGFSKDWWADAAIGYKIFDYSFVSLGYRYIGFEYKWSKGGRLSNPFFQTGWDSQDNPNFPTQGSRLLVGFDWYRYRNSRPGYLMISGSYLKHWNLSEGNVLSLRLGSFRGNDPGFYVSEDQAASLRYTRILKRAEGSDIKKTAYYIEPGRFYGYGNPIHGARAGTTLQTDHGVINLFLLGGVQK